MSLFNKFPLTSIEYQQVNPTNSNPPPMTATGMASDAEFRGQHAVPTPPNPMKGGYLHKSPSSRRAKYSYKKNKHSKKPKSFVASMLGTNVSPLRASMGGNHRRKPFFLSPRQRNMGMTLARGRSGGSRRRGRKTRRRNNKRRRGGMGGMNQGFPTGYATPSPLNPNLNLSALANPPTYVPNYGS
jgi:hypothetical protein